MEGERVNPPVQWLGEHLRQGAVIARVGRFGDDLIAEFPNVAILRANRSGESSTLEPLAGATPAALEKLRTGVVAALLRHLRGRPTLHAGAVALEGRALGFLGDSGAGKSTLVEAFCSRDGGSLVADDILAIEMRRPAQQEVVIEAAPTQREIWRHSKSAAIPETFAKEPVSPRNLCPGPVPLAGLILLKFDDDLTAPELRRLRGQDAFGALTRSMVRFAIDDPVLLAREFDNIDLIVARCPIFEMRRSRSLEQLDWTVRVAHMALDVGGIQ
jgi:hypothetical protein